MELEKHYSKYKLIITGTVDLVTDTYSIVDLKTSAGEWKEESIKNKLQKIIYLYMMYKLTREPKLWFEYAILRTDLKLDKNIKLQTVKTELDISAFEYILSSLIDSYLYSYQHNVYATKQCDACWYCGL
jgi:DNA polymerase III gamma/tau subunit